MSFAVKRRLEHPLQLSLFEVLLKRSARGDHPVTVSLGTGVPLLPSNERRYHERFTGERPSIA